MPTIKLPRSENLIGRRFGRLVVIEKSTERYRGWVTWKCICDCGAVKNIPSAYLKNGHTKSCGCLKIGKNNGTRPGNCLSHGEAALRHLYRSYKTNAKRRRIDFHISLDDFRILTGQSYYYCGKLPKQVLNFRSCNGEYTYNGLDRANNTKGYSIDNCVPCCKTCNSAKGILSQDEFKEWIKSIYKNFGERK